ncbi:hypothetical protein L218DRAFT_1004574 [Marasmius fiardii PR-910]|nr:hypothetical protein L218DRAFT_1004574 [Marasmius fiardii PR-910]
MVNTFILHELWATDHSIDVLYRLGPPMNTFQTVTKHLLKRLGGAPFTHSAFSLQHPLLPKLKWLTLRVQSHFDADEDFVEWVKSRWFRSIGDSPSLHGREIEVLRTVELHVVERSLENELYEPLKEVDEDGMMISVFGDGKRVV